MWKKFDLLIFLVHVNSQYHSFHSKPIDKLLPFRFGVSLSDAIKSQTRENPTEKFMIEQD
jgi:hypothetical protein